MNAPVSQLLLALLATTTALAQPAKAPLRPALPTPPAELAELAKVSGGTWKCKGDALAVDGTRSPISAISVGKLDLDKWWLVETMEIKGLPIGTFKMTTFTTYDATGKKWRRIGADNWGTQVIGTAEATPLDKPKVFNLDTMGPLGAGLLREHADPADPKAVKVWGESSTDRGKTWTKLYEMVCKR